MSTENHNSADQLPKTGSERKSPAPEWADGLKQLYDAVVDEPLPDSFKDLLAQLDENDSPADDTK